MSVGGSVVGVGFGVVEVSAYGCCIVCCIVVLVGVSWLLHCLCRLDFYLLRSLGVFTLRFLIQWSCKYLHGEGHGGPGCCDCLAAIRWRVSQPHFQRRWEGLCHICVFFLLGPGTSAPPRRFMPHLRFLCFGPRRRCCHCMRQHLLDGCCALVKLTVHGFCFLRTGFISVENVDCENANAMGTVLTGT